MPKFAANLTMLYNEVDFLDRFAAAAKNGFKGVEYLFPYAYPKEQLAEKLKQNGLTQVLHNLPAGDWAKGERGIACHPDRVGEFKDGVGKAIEYATTLGCKQVNCLAGIAPQGVDANKLRETFVSNLKYAAAELEKAKNLLITDALRERETNNGKAFALGQAIVLEGDAARVNRSLDALQAVTAADVQRVMRKYIGESKPVVISYVAEGAE